MIQVTHPLCDRNMISARLDAVSEIAESMGSSRASQNIGGTDGEDSDITIVQPEFNYLLSSVVTTLGRSPDIQRGITRIFHRTATPSEVINAYPLLYQCVLLYLYFSINVYCYTFINI
jgi:DNA mismatch repair protein MSH3